VDGKKWEETQRGAHKRMVIKLFSTVRENCRQNENNDAYVLITIKNGYDMLVVRTAV